MLFITVILQMLLFEQMTE